MGIYTIVLALRAAPNVADAAVPGHEFLMIRTGKRGGLWELPGGRGEPGEGALACARREFREETGYEWEAARLIQRRRTPIGEGHVFRCELGNRLAAPEPDVKDVRFVPRLPPPDQLGFPDDPYDGLFAAARRDLEAWQAGLAGPK